MAGPKTEIGNGNGHGHGADAGGARSGYGGGARSGHGGSAVPWASDFTPPTSTTSSASSVRSLSVDSSSSPVRRKPLPFPPSQLTKSSTLPSTPTLTTIQRPHIHTIPHSSLDIPLASHSTPAPPSLVVVRDLDRYPRGQSPLIPPSEFTQAPAITKHAPIQALPPPVFTKPIAGNIATIPVTTTKPPGHARDISLTRLSETSDSSDVTSISGLEDVHSHVDNRSMKMALHPLDTQRNASLHLDVNPRKYSHQSDDSHDSTMTSKPRSPSKIGSFFGWKTTASPVASSATTFASDKTSPAPSPQSPQLSPKSLPSPANKRNLAAIDVPKANNLNLIHTDSGLSIPATPLPLAGNSEVEEELREISSELASSIRREMDLEDLVDRLQSEASNVSGSVRRTSDYFSDSGTSSVRFPSGDDLKHVELEKLQRRTEQEKAQLRLDLSQKVQAERTRRRSLEAQVQDLEDRLAQANLKNTKPTNSTGRVRDLEMLLDDLRRRLAEERKVRENFEDLLTALRGEVDENRNERDNLRDEVVPQLRARVEGLEAAAAEFQKLTYENTRMQQELQNLKNENSTLLTAKNMQLETQQQQPRFNSIAEDAVSPASPSPTLMKRSSSAARFSASGAASLRLNRSNSLKERESRDSLADRVRDIEAQRDALHEALKSLLDRQDYQTKEANKRIRNLEIERDRALTSTPGRQGYDKEVSNLRAEINHLRRRADEALDQKWQCEKGLSGLKMDLDRAEQETTTLRTLLHEHDILIPEIPGQRRGQESLSAAHATTATLEKAYRDLQITHALSLARLAQINGEEDLDLKDSATKNGATLNLLHETMKEAEAEREYAQKQAQAYRVQAESLQHAQRGHVSEEQKLATQLRTSAARVEELSVEVRQQLDSNNTLRERLTEAIRRGERDQKSSADRIIRVQGKLKALEDKLMIAQQRSEEAVAKHEKEIRELKDNHNSQLLRLKNGPKSPARLTPPRSPLFATRSPRIGSTTSGPGLSMVEASRTEYLEKRVEELEMALTEADKEMAEVVCKMNMAQIEVLDLQSERDEAIRRTRKLQAAVDKERENASALMT
ncbi:MAG: hypothetical protein M1829_002675 [Trizodia sp. TS-e1964]|nr:MAG: hypothetical protein M1829_002675 [Trizodia sp. TS-e1964]